MVLLARRRPMHPGANVGVDLIIWLILIILTPAAFIAAITNLNAVYDQGYRDSPGYLTYANGTTVTTWAKGACPGYSISCDQLAARRAIYHTLGAVELAASIFSSIALYVARYCAGTLPSANPPQTFAFHALCLGLR